MPLPLSYEAATSRGSAARRFLARLLRSRLARVAGVVVLYVAVYCGLRATRVLVHRNYLYWDRNAPGSPPGGGYVEVDDVGHGSFFDQHGSSMNGSVDRFCRIGFYPLVKAEESYWRRNNPANAKARAGVQDSHHHPAATGD